MAVALPVLTKAHEFCVNQPIAGNATAITQNAIHMATLLGMFLGTSGTWTDDTGAPIAGPTNPWTLIQANGRVNGPGATDIWGSNPAAECVWATTGNYPWAVIENVDGVQVLIGLRGSGATTLVVQWSASVGFTGGTATALPTASDSAPLHSTATGMGLPSAASTNRVFHMVHSVDGTCTTLFVCTGGFVTATFFVNRVREADASLLLPFVIGSCGVASNANHAVAGTPGLFYHVSPVCRFRHAAQTSLCHLMIPGSGGSSAVDSSILHQDTRVSSFGGGWRAYDIMPFGITMNSDGPLGLLTDIWAGSLTIANATNMPDGVNPAGETARQFAFFNGLWVPWNLSAALAS